MDGCTPESGIRARQSTLTLVCLPALEESGKIEIQPHRQRGIKHSKP